MTLVESIGRSRAEAPPLPSIEQVYRSHGDFVWSCLQRFGVRPSELDDALQEVFIVVHAQLASFRGDARITTWLYAICLRVAARCRRRTRRTIQSEEILTPPTDGPIDPERGLAQAQRQRVLERILDELDLDKRAVFVMFEIDELPCEEIASIVGVPVGTVYSRLHAARKSFEKAIARFRARTRKEGLG